MAKNSKVKFDPTGATDLSTFYKEPVSINFNPGLIVPETPDGQKILRGRKQIIYKWPIIDDKYLSALAKSSDSPQYVDSNEYFSDLNNMLQKYGKRRSFKKALKSNAYNQIENKLSDFKEGGDIVLSSSDVGHFIGALNGYGVPYKLYRINGDNGANFKLSIPKYKDNKKAPKPGPGPGPKPSIDPVIKEDEIIDTIIRPRTDEVDEKQKKSVYRLPDEMVAAMLQKYEFPWRIGDHPLNKAPRGAQGFAKGLLSNIYTRKMNEQKLQQYADATGQDLNIEKPKPKGVLKRMANFFRTSPGKITLSGDQPLTRVEEQSMGAENIDNQTKMAIQEMKLEASRLYADGQKELAKAKMRMANSMVQQAKIQAEGGLGMTKLITGGTTGGKKNGGLGIDLSVYTKKK